ncbi:MAG TPA: hypothetical protein VMX94_01675 [Armatimonadota bacterium]|nr:hypothetical protein [Armatimonadota bacterium]
MGHEDTVDVAVECLLIAASDHNHEEQQHCRRVEMLCAMTAKAMGWETGDVEALRLAALLHHTDRSRIPESALALNVAEFLREFNQRVADPTTRDQMSGGRPAEAASIIALVDAFDRLVSNQRYRPSLSDSAAIEILQHDAETPVDIAVLEAFRRAYAGKHQVRQAKAA